jgi:repressor LexA
LAVSWGFPVPGISTTIEAELEKKGWITRISGKSRGIRLTKHASSVPVKGTIAAGAPLDIYPDAPSLLRVDDLWT